MLPYFTLVRGSAIMFVHGITPGRVMAGFFVGRGSVGSAVGLYKDEFRWVILLLHYVERGNSRLLDTGPGIGKSSLFESFNRLGLDSNLNMHNEHEFPFA
jgi:hypothetical protein